MAAARDAELGALGGSRSITMSIGPSAAADIAAWSVASSPVSGTGRRRGPNRSARRSSAAWLRPGGDHAARSHRERDRAAAEIAGGPADEQRLAGCEPACQQPAVGDGVHGECGPAGRIVPCHGGQREDVLRRDPHELGERTVVQIPGEPRAALAARAPALERDVGRQGVVRERTVESHRTRSPTRSRVASGPTWTIRPTPPTPGTTGGTRG